VVPSCRAFLCLIEALGPDGKIWMESELRSAVLTLALQ